MEIVLPPAAELRQGQAKLPANLPPMDPALVKMTRWLSDVLTLQAWWQSKTPEERAQPATIDAAAKRIRALFPSVNATATQEEKMEEARKTAKLQEMFTRQQLVALTECMARVLAS